MDLARVMETSRKYLHGLSEIGKIFELGKRTCSEG